MNKNQKLKKIDANSTLSMKTTRKSGIVTIKNNKTAKLPFTTSRTTTTTSMESIVDDYMVAEDFLNKELSELELSEEYAQLEEKLNENNSATKLKVETSQNNGRKLDKNQQINFNPINNPSADHEWNRALGIANENTNHQDNSKDLMPAFLPPEGQNLGNNQLAQFNARSGAAAQKQDLIRKDAEITPGSNTGKVPT